jgi:hypothetical protein
MDGVGIGELKFDGWYFVQQWFVAELSDMLELNPQEQSNGH